MSFLLDQVISPTALRKLSVTELNQLAAELRQYIIDIVAAKEGHLGASLGVVELTIALHYIFNTPEDQLIWDVGHQAYGHKILTQRKGSFITNRQFGGISGFPKITESIYDSFGTGHASTSISAALGMAVASKLNGNSEKHHIAVIGDASIAGGMAFEGLNHAGVTQANLLVILNDNAIGIDPSVGALKNYLTNVKNGTESQDNIFEALNFNYYGPVDGHNLEQLLSTLETLKDIKGPKFLHVTTTKGKGLKKAEEDQVTYHAPGKFNPNTGELIPKHKTNKAPKYQDVFGETLVELASKNEDIVGITPAMPTGSSLTLMMEAYPDRAFDVGIAEQHAVTFAAGLATQGKVVYCNIYSTFLQRAYDQVIHDVALQNIPVIFCLDRAGLVGEDGPTHHGVFDMAYLRCIPNLTIFAPRDEIALRNMLYTCQLKPIGPVAIRYPRGQGITVNWKKPFKPIEIGKATPLKIGEKLAILSIGTMALNVSEAIENIASKAIISHYDMGFVKPLDESCLLEVFKTHQQIITVEEGCVSGGFGSAILEFAAANNFTNPIKIIGIPDTFIDQGKVSTLHQKCNLSVSALEEQINTILIQLD